MDYLAPPHLRGRRRPLGHASSGTIAISSASCSTPNPSRRPHVNMQGPAEPVVRRALHLFATALAMLDLVHLATIKKFNQRFLDLALHPPIDPTLRPPSLQEILQADRAVWASIFELTSDHAWSLPDALNETRFCGGEMANLPQPPCPPSWSAVWIW